MSTTQGTPKTLEEFHAQYQARCRMDPITPSAIHFRMMLKDFLAQKFGTAYLSENPACTRAAQDLFEAIFERKGA